VLPTGFHLIARGNPDQGIHDRMALAPDFFRPCCVRVSAGFEVRRLAHNRALHYLARQREYRLSDLLRQQLTQVVEGYTGH
jgi:hypothetical protein